MKIRYTRVSNQDPNLYIIDALKEVGCKKIFQEKISGAKSNRPELQKMIEQIREDDIIVIWKLDRLGRSLKDLVQLMKTINDKGAGLNSLQDRAIISRR